MIEDVELLRRYADEKSEEAFAELVRRRVGLVYAIALRQCQRSMLAEEVTQKVFTVLADQATTLAQRPTIVGWLYRTAQFAANDARRAEFRRQGREQTAYLMQQIHDESKTPDWEKLQPWLDELLAAMNDTDREAILLRFFDGRSFTEIGTALSVPENTARMRVQRALDKLERRLARRGLISSTAVLATACAGQANAVTPVYLAGSVSRFALTHSAQISGAAWVALFTMKKIQIVVLSAALLSALVPSLFELRAHQVLQSELAALSLAPPPVAFPPLPATRPMEKAVAAVASPGQTAELARWQSRVAQLKARPEGVVDSSMKAPSNRGWETPEATIETMHWAVVNGDWKTLAHVWRLEGAAKQKADEFFSTLSPVTQEKYGSVEAVLAHVQVELSRPKGNAWMTSMQVLDTQVIADGATRVRIWRQIGSGKEFRDEMLLQPSAEGWVMSGGLVATRLVQKLLPMIDPWSGEPLSKP